jgi:protein-tyrosine phosphatase
MKIKVLMVCLGNICRSPLAEGILQSKVNFEKVHVDSAGTGSWHVGNKPDSRSIAVAQKHGLDISSQRCRQFITKDFDEFDIIYVMDKSNFSNVTNMARSTSDTSKVKLLLSEIDNNETEVPDPYHDSDDGFEKVYQMINEVCGTIANKLENKKY